MTQRFAGRTVLVTGASRGLGAAIALGFGREAADVVVNYRERRNDAKAVAERICAAGGQAVAVQADCTNEHQVETMLDAALAAFGEIRILVNNSGILSRSRIADMTPEVWDKMMHSHLRSHSLVTRACLRHSMLGLEPRAGERIAAKIINLGSGLVRRGGLSARAQVHYMTAKTCVEGFTRGLAAELAPQITVNLLAPGIHMTDMVGQQSKDIQAAMAAYFLLGLLENRDVVSTALFVASADADHITAETFTMNGGSS